MTEQHPDRESSQQSQPAASASAEQQPAQPERWFDETWTMVHPLSPFVRGWVTVVAIPGIIFGYNWQMWADAWAAFRSGELQRDVASNPTPFILAGAGALLIILLIFGGFVLSWWFTRYKITAEHVMVKSGIFVRQHRQARIDRVQAVDLRQPLLARLTGLAELKFEVAEGDDTAATLAFLKKAQAEELRREIMDRASGREGTQQTPQEPPAGHPAAAERQIAKVPTGRLVGAVLTGWGTVFLLIVILGGLTVLGIGLVEWASAPEGERSAVWAVLTGATIPAMVPAAITVATVYYQQFSAGFGFTSTMTSAGLRIRYGLLETTNQTIPPGRVQAIQIQQPMLWRKFHWFRVVVVVAGYGVAEKRSVLLPVGRFDDVMATAAEMFPDLQVPEPEELFTTGLLGRGTEQGFTEVPHRARMFDPFVRRRRGFRTTPAALMFRDGRASRRLTMVPHERIQSLSLQQGPLQRRRAVADVHIHSPSGPFQARLKNQDLDAVQELFELESAHAAQARRYSDRNQWMRPEELHEFERKVAEVAGERAAQNPETEREPPRGAPHASEPLERDA